MISTRLLLVFLLGLAAQPVFAETPEEIDQKAITAKIAAINGAIRKVRKGDDKPLTTLQAETNSLGALASEFKSKYGTPGFFSTIGGALRSVAHLPLSDPKHPIKEAARTQLKNLGFDE